ncbi:MAG: protein kinase, partial [Caldilineaceae bacterium]|nr:protein kinase [Caldilineaceae bacterium]
MTLATGQQLQQGRYVIRQRLGQGGMGTVYLAEDRNLDGQLVAIKENLDPSADTQTQFRLTALMLARLSHPNLPRVTDHFIDSNGYQYLVMDYIAGQDLNQILGQHGPLQEDVALAWIEQVMAALDYLHNWVNPTTGKGTPIIHRDIKPSNIKVTPTGQVVLVDFGLAKQEGEEGTLIGARGVTPGYSPVEQYTGGTDIRSDVYALGATLYTLLTGRKPPDAPQIAANATLTPPRRINSKIRASTERAILRAMSTQASERFQSTADFRTALRTKVTLPLASDFAIGSGSRNRPFAQRRNQYIVMAGIVVVSLMLVANLVLSRQGALLPRTEAATTVASPTDADGTALAVVDSVGGEPSPTATPLSTATTPPEATPATTAVNTAPSPTLIASPTATAQSAGGAAAANGAPSATPSATFSATPFATATLVNTPTFAPTASATTTSTPTATQPATPSATATPMPATATVTAFPTPTATATPVPSATAR